MSAGRLETELLTREECEALRAQNPPPFYSVRIGDRVKLRFNEAKRTIVIGPEKETSKEDQRIARLTLDFINRYRKDLESLAKK